MSNDEIKELIQLVVESGIAELEIAAGRGARSHSPHDRERRRTVPRPPPATMVETAHRPRSFGATRRLPRTNTS
jgi:hypothetical protein